MKNYLDNQRHLCTEYYNKYKFSVGYDASVQYKLGLAPTCVGLFSTQLLN